MRRSTRSREHADSSQTRIGSPSSRPSETGRSSRSPKPTWNAPSPRLRQVKLKGPRTFDPVQQCDEAEVVKLLGRSGCTGHHSPKCGGPREALDAPASPDEESSGDSALDPQRRLSDTEVAALLTAHDPTAARRRTVAALHCGHTGRCPAARVSRIGVAGPPPRRTGRAALVSYPRPRYLLPHSPVKRTRVATSDGVVEQSRGKTRSAARTLPLPPPPPLLRSGGTRTSSRRQGACWPWLEGRDDLRPDCRLRRSGGTAIPR